jgi:molybdopterin molybdotransferase
VIDAALAGAPAKAALEPGTCVQIATGGLLPSGADVVIPLEDTRPAGDAMVLPRASVEDYGGAQPHARRWVREAGSELQRDEPVIAAGTRLGAGELALLAAAGWSDVPVIVRPRVAILASGDELVPIGAALDDAAVVATNGLMLAAQVSQAGGVPLLLPPASDEPAALAAAIASARSCDIIVTTGGISVGPRDGVIPALTAAGTRWAVRKIQLRPGRPTSLGALAGTLVIALPGNPASSFVGAELFVRPAITGQLGLRRDPERGWASLPLAAPAPAAGRRTHLVRARIERGELVPLGQQRSSDLRSLAGVDALIVVPPGPELPAGAIARALVLRPAALLEASP